MKQTTHLAFDLDGTLFDVSPIALNAFETGLKSFRHVNIIIPSHDKIIALLGTPIDEIFNTLFPKLSKKKQLLLNDHCTDSFIKLINQGKGILFEGVTQTLSSLYHQSYSMVIASNGRSQYIKAILDYYNITRFFTQPLIYLSKTIQNKNAIVQKYKERHSENELMIMIGDIKCDIDAATANNIPFIGCAFGHGCQSEIEKTPWIANSFIEIPKLIKQIETIYHK